MAKGITRPAANPIVEDDEVVLTGNAAVDQQPSEDEVVAAPESMGTVKIQMLDAHKCHIAGADYVFAKGRTYAVNADVAHILCYGGFAMRRG